MDARRAQLYIAAALTNLHLYLLIHGSTNSFFLNLLHGISHGFDITHDLLVMVWHFKDILRFVL